MASKPTNHGKEWTKKDISILQQLAGQNTPTRIIGLKMGRTPEAVQSAASENDISLKPTNQNPYNRREK